MGRFPVDYRSFRFSKLNTPEFSHLKLLLYWPLFGLLFFFVERLSPVEEYFPIYCTLDDLIPFCEFFLIPYLFWFVYLVGMHLYTLLCDVAIFRRFMWFIILSYSAAILIYLLFPTCQELRPAAFERDNPFTRFLFYFYQFDTHTNVCPSIHVIGSAAVWCASLRIQRFQTPAWRLAFGISGALICASTVFLKQHSTVDVLAAIPICVLADYLAFQRKAPARGPVSV